MYDEALKVMAKAEGRKSGEEVILRHAASDQAAPETEVMVPCLDELVRYYRHSAVGRRCTGVIHNMNTPLQVISFQLELLEQKSLEEASLFSNITPVPPELLALHEYRDQKLRQLHHEVNNLREMIHRIALQAVHEGQEEHCYLDLNQILQDELELYLADPFFKHRVEKEVHFSPSLPPIHGHYVDFSQSFRHLVDNALEAMAESPRRRLTIKTSIKRDCRVLQVGDTGIGISPSLKSHLFQPFFTTKSTKETPRAGLGLFMTKRLLDPYKAEITIESRPGQTWVKVYLPISQKT